jgi:hypothetical protein
LPEEVTTILDPSCKFDHLTLHPGQILTAASVTDCPGHNSVGPDAVITGVDGNGNDKTWIVFEVPLCPQAFVKTAE